ncbi:MAG: DMT family transporter [Anaerolineae bacterium]|nr:DMT family transporter [Anaerolineae bacterium]
MVDLAAQPKVTARWVPYAALTGAVVIFSFGAIFVRLAQAQQVPSLVIAALRYTFGAAILAPVVLRQHGAEIRQMPRRDLVLVGLAGIAMGISLFLYFSTLEHTTVMITNLFTNTSPLWIGLAEVLILKAVLDRRVWLGVILALGGGLLFSLTRMDGSSMGLNPSMGIVLALASALFSTAYFILARAVRARVSALAYLWLTLISGTILLLIVALALGIPLIGYPLEGYFWILVVTLTGQITGQFLMAYTLAYLPATVVSVAMLAQVMIGAVLALILFGEQPGLLQVVASAVILLGVGVVITARAQPSRN